MAFIESGAWEEELRCQKELLGDFAMWYAI